MAEGLVVEGFGGEGLAVAARLVAAVNLFLAADRFLRAIFSRVNALLYNCLSPGVYIFLLQCDLFMALI